MGLLKDILDGFIASFDLEGSRPPKPAFSDSEPSPPAVNDAVAYGVRIEPAVVAAGQPYWRAARVHHLTPAENGGNHHIFLDVFDGVRCQGNPFGARIFGARLKVTWQDDEAIVTIEKPLGEPGINFPMWKSQLCSVQALGLPGDELPSDRVTGLHIRHPDEAPGNTWGHHSFAITFVRTKAQTVGESTSVISGRVSHGAGRVVKLSCEEQEVAQQPVSDDETYRFAELRAGAYRVSLVGLPISTPPLILDGTDSVTADLTAPPPDKRVMHYVLFGPAEQPATLVNLLLAQGFVLALQPAFGFDPEEAREAGMVTIIADDHAVSADIEAQLRAGGALVERMPARRTRSRPG